MSIRFLESVAQDDDSVLQQIDDGATLNFQIACQKDGAIHGCAITNSATTISIGIGLLMVRGYRLKFDSQTVVFTLANSAYPASSTKYYLWLKITRTGSNASYEFFQSTNNTSTNRAAIEKSEGVYDYKVAEYNLGPSGIIGAVKSLIANIPVPGSGASGSTSIGIGIALPEPRIELVQSAESTLTKYGMAGSLLCLGNKNDYAKYVGNYTIKFVVYRFVERGRYRNRKNGSKLYVEKTGFVKPLQLGWNPSSKVKLTYSYADLYTAIVCKSGAYNYRRTDVILPIKSLIDKTFYYKVDGVKTVVDSDTPVASIRCIRSRRNRVGYPKHNFLKIAFKAELWDSAGKKVTESGLSRTLTIVTNLTAVGKQTITYGERFRVLIDK